MSGCPCYSRGQAMAQGRQRSRRVSGAYCVEVLRVAELNGVTKAFSLQAPLASKDPRIPLLVKHNPPLGLFGNGVDVTETVSVVEPFTISSASEWR